MMRFRLRTLSLTVGALIAIGTVFNPALPARAELTGVLQGTVTATSDGSAIANVRVTANSPTAKYSSITDTHGFYVITGVLPDTYTVSFEKDGFETASLRGITVTAGGQMAANIVLRASVRVLGRIVVQSPNSAFQPTHTMNTYSVQGAALQTVQGDSFNTDVNSLLTTLPSITMNNLGVWYVRGGPDYAAQLSFEGIPYNNEIKNIGGNYQFANGFGFGGFTNANSNTANAGLYNGVASVNIAPGANGGTQGDTGTGLVSLQAKRGTQEGFGALDLESDLYPFNHQVGFEYGKSTASGNLSAYVSYRNHSLYDQYGAFGTDVALINNGATLWQSDQYGQDLVANLVLKFGRDQRESLQGFIQSQDINNDNDIGYSVPFLPAGSFNSLASGLTPPQPFGPAGVELTPADFERLSPPLPPLDLQPGVSPPIKDYQSHILDAYKLEYGINFSSATSLAVRAYHQQSIDKEWQEIGYYEDPWGGNTNGAALDFTTQLNEKNLITFGGDYNFSSPYGTQYSTNFQSIIGSYAAGYEVSFFCPSPLTPTPAAPYCVPSLPIVDFLDPNGPTCAALIPALALNDCGYLSKYFPANSPAHLPVEVTYNNISQGKANIYLNDAIRFSRSLAAEVGAEYDSTNLSVPPDPFLAVNQASLIGYHSPLSDFAHENYLNPHIGVTYSIGNRDSIRMGFGSTYQPVLSGLSTLSSIGTLGGGPTGPYAAFANIPSHSAYTGGPANWCGLYTLTPCANYADELYWDLLHYYYGGNLSSAQPSHGTTYANYDLSYSHQFPSGVAFRITPFYRRGYGITTSTSRYLGFNLVTQQPIFSPTILRNDGIDRNTGVELYLTQQKSLGLSYLISATYQNEVSTSNAFTSQDAGSAFLGDTYHIAGFSPFQASAALDYRLKDGLRINPIVQFNRGYWFGSGLRAPWLVNGTYYQVPNTNEIGGSEIIVDPANPGTFFNPHVLTREGLIEGPAAGDILAAPRVTGDLTIEYKVPRSRETLGFAVTNLFNQIYDLPFHSQTYQPVQQGIGGPLTGVDPCVASQRAAGITNPGTIHANCGWYGYQPDMYPGDIYNIFPDLTPRIARFYVQWSL